MAVGRGIDDVATAAVDLASMRAAPRDLLRRDGVHVSPDQLQRFVSAIALTAPAAVDDLYWVARVTLVVDRGQFEAFDRVFNRLFRGYYDWADTRGDPAAAQSARERPRRDRVRSGFESHTPAGAPTAPDWKGGTRIGSALKEFIDGYGRRGLARGAVIAIVSDGWDRDDPRLAAPEFAPLVGGMAAALPYCDALVSGNTLAAFRDAICALSGSG